MSRSKSLTFVIIFLITASALTTILKAQDTEVNNSPIQEFIRKAEQHVELDQIEDAIVLYERIVIAAPDDDESRLQLALLYSRMNQHEKAAETYSKLLEIDSENIVYQDGFVSSLYAAGNEKEAFDQALEYIEAEPDRGNHYARIARLYEVDGNEDAAIANYNKATEFGYRNKQTYLSLARLNILNLDMDAAEIALQNAIFYAKTIAQREDLEGKLFNFYRFNGDLEKRMHKAEEYGTMTWGLQELLAEYYHQSGDMEKSVETYKRAHEMTTATYQQNRITDALLKVYAALGDMDSVEEVYENQVNSDPNSKTYHYTAARITAIFEALYIVETTSDTLIEAFKSQDKLEVLKSHYESKLEEDIDNSMVLTILARIYWIEKNYQKAAAMYEALGKTDSNNVRYLYYAAAALKKSNQPELTKEMLNQAAKALASFSEKDNAWFLGALATICIENRMYEPAIELSKAAIQKIDIDTDRIQDTLYIILAKSYRGTKRYEEAIEAFQELADNSRTASVRNMAKKAASEVAKEGGLYEKWIPEQLNKVVMKPNDPSLILTLADSYETTDMILKAIEQYEKLTKLDPENVYWYRKLGDLYQRVDLKVDEDIVSKALSLNGDGSYVEIDDSEKINNISEQVTVSAWIKPIDFPNTCTTILFKGNKRQPNITHRQFTFWLFDEGCIFFDTSPNGMPLKYTISANESIKKNNWYHIAGTIDAKNNIMKLYLNGSEVRKNDFRGENYLLKTTLPFRIGCSHEEDRSEHASFAGLIDEVQIWNIARSESQIRSDMNKQLNGDEAGLVGYWKFDTETEGRIADSSRNKIGGKLIGNAKLQPYTRSVLGGLKHEHLTRSASYYEKAIELTPNIYRYYDLLGKLFLDHNQISDAIAVYQRALDAPLKQADHDLIIRTIYELYTNEGQEDKLIPVLEKVKPKMQESVVLHELLGDLYKKIGNSEKAELAYAEWLRIKLKEGDIQQASYQRRIAEELLKKEIFPDIALKFAKRALHNDTDLSHFYPITLGHAYIANDLYDDALRYYIYALSILPANSSLDYFLQQVADAGKSAKDEGRYKQMLNALNNSIPRGYLSSLKREN